MEILGQCVEGLVIVGALVVACMVGGTAASRAAAPGEPGAARSWTEELRYWSRKENWMFSGPVAEGGKMTLLTSTRRSRLP